jgi:hypothetical protein
MGGDFGIDIVGGEGVEAAPLGAVPSLLQPIRRRRDGANKIPNAHDHDGRFAAPIDDEPVVVFGYAIHDLAELSARDMSVDAPVHIIPMHQLFNASI